jgi:surface antigen Omp85-like protein
VLVSIVVLAGLLTGAELPERLVDIQVHGNTLTADAEIIRIAGLQPGMPIGAKTFDEAADRLRDSHKFEHVEVLKRFASIADPSEIVLVIIVDEGPVTIGKDGTVTAGADGPPNVAGVQKRRGLGFMYLPILNFEDGYGFSYGVRVAAPEAFGKNSRVSVPAAWGGQKQVGIIFDQEIGRGASRLQTGVELVQRANPFFEEPDDRRRVWVRGERDVTRSLRIGATADWQHVSFFDVADRMVRTGADVVVDTRIDPVLARNAVYARAAWDHLAFGTAADANRSDLEARGYVGLFGQNVVVVRGLRQDSSRPLPPYLSPLLGGTATLRGFRAGSDIGDTLVASSIEWRLPLTSPLSFGKVGVSAFVDAATVYDKGERMRRQRFDRGFGGGVWLSAPFVRMHLSVAHGVGRSTRVQVATSVLF